MFRASPAYRVIYFLSSKGTTAISPLDFSSFENMFYFKSFGSTQVINNNSIVSGAINIFKNNINSQAVITYLSGHSYLIFLIIGVFSSLIKELKGIEKAVL